MHCMHFMTVESLSGTDPVDGLGVAAGIGSHSDSLDS